MQWGPWSEFLVFGGGACLVLGAVHLFAAQSVPKRGLTLWLGVLGLLTSGKALLEAGLYESTTPEGYGVVMKAQLAVSLLWVCALASFVHAVVGRFQRSLRSVWVVALGALVVNLALPHGLVFSRVDSLREGVLPWGETISIGGGELSSLRWMLDLVGVVFASFCIVSCVRAFRVCPRRDALLLSIGSFLIVVLGMGHAWLVDLGAVDLPYLVTPVVFGFIGLFTLDLARSLVASRRLAHEVLQRERWGRTLLRDIEVLVGLTDSEGRLVHVNPAFCRATGVASAELVGRPLLDLIPPAERTAHGALLFDRSTTGGAVSRRGGLLGEEGARCIQWSSIGLRDPAGAPTGRLLVGYDVTVQREAELACDAARAEVEALRERLDREVYASSPELGDEAGASAIVGDSLVVRELRTRAARVARTDITVLVQGETGVGKELVAEAIHEQSGRTRGPLVRVNCGAIPQALAESELFGHRAGAFTDARTDHVGLFERANGGTLLLDEVGELPPEIQPKLLRALQCGEYSRVGESTVRQSDVRLVAATNRDLQEEVRCGRFRADLFYRLSVFLIEVPALRERSEDIPLLVERLLPRLCGRLGVEVPEVPAPLLTELRGHGWPGNVRELINVLERALVVSRGGSLRLADRLSPDPGQLAQRSGERTGGPRLDDVVRQHIEAILEATEGRISGPKGAAELLGLNPSTLRGRMRKLGLARKGAASPG